MRFRSIPWQPREKRPCMGCSAFRRTPRSKPSCLRLRTICAICTQKATCSVGAWSSGKCSGTSTVVSRFCALYRNRIPRSRTRRRVLSVRQRTDGTGPCPARGHVSAGPSRCPVFPHLRTSPAVNIGPGQVSCCGGAGPQASQCPACQGRDTRLSAWPRSLCGLGTGECRP